MKRRARSNARSLFAVTLVAVLSALSLLQMNPAEARRARSTVRIADACASAAYLERHNWPDVRGGYFRDIHCTEVDRAITEAAREFGINEAGFRTNIWCESKFHPFVGKKYVGLTQANTAPGGFWSVQVARFNAELRPGQPPVTGNVTAPFDNARVAARVVSREGYRQWDPRCRP